jgi:glycerol-3-phosphate dehydrogenase
MDDVVVVGGGATGVGVARDLSMRGLPVTLLERGPLCAGTTGRSHGLLHSGARYATDDPEGAAECITENRTLRETVGAAVAPTGGLFLELDGDDPGYFDQKREACRDLDIPAELTDDTPDGVTCERALRVPDAVVSPSRLVAATAADAADRGATVRTRTRVEGLLVEEGRVAGVRTEAGTVDASHVVNATGAWAGDLAATAGVEVTMTPTRGVMVVAGGDLGTVLNRCRKPDDGDIVVPQGDRVVLGTTSVPVENPDDYPTEEWEVQRTLAECAEMYDHGDIERTYWGVRPLYAGEASDTRAVSRGFHVLDHADRDGLAGFTTVVGGKLTTHRLMAEAVSDLVADRLGAGAACRTDEVPLARAGDPGALDDLVARYGGPGPADEHVIGG